MTRILVFAGSTRQGSFNKQLARLAARDVVVAGAEATFIDLREFPMPLYDGDMEAGDGPPEHAFRLQEIVAQHPGTHDVRIVAEARTRYQEVISLMDAARAAGLSNAALEGTAAEEI